MKPIIKYEDHDFIIELFYNKITDKHFYHLYQKEYIWKWNWYNSYVGVGKNYEAAVEAMNILKNAKED